MQQIRHILVLIITLCLHATHAVAADVVIGGITYSLTSSTHRAVVIAPKDTNNKYKGNITIPGTVVYNGTTYEVTSIGARAFKDCKNLECIRMEEGLTTVEESAFSQCYALKTIFLPSTMTTLAKQAFYLCTRIEEIHCDVANPATTGDYPYTGLAVNGTVFSNTTNAQAGFKVYVPKRAHRWYVDKWCAQTVGFTPANILGEPSPLASITVTPATDVVTDYTALGEIWVDFTFADASLADAVSLVPHEQDEMNAGNYYVKAVLTMDDGRAITLDSRQWPEAFSTRDNRLTLAFAYILERYKEYFVARNENDLATHVRLTLEGMIALEDCPYNLSQTSALMGTPTWEVALMPTVFDLDTLPAISPAPNATTEQTLRYTDVQNMVLDFGTGETVGIDPATGAYVEATLYVNDEPLEAKCAVSAEDGSLTLAWAELLPYVLVRRATGITSFRFALDLKAQVRLADGKSYRFSLPSATSADAVAWTVAAEVIPEPTGIAVVPQGGGVVTTKDLGRIGVTLEGVEQVVVDGEISATLRCDGEIVATYGATDVTTEGNTLWLTTDAVTDELITRIADTAYHYEFRLALKADVLTDGYDFHVSMADDDMPSWQAEAILLPLPIVSVRLPETTPDETISLSDLTSMEVVVENYKTVSLPEGAEAWANIMRDGKAVCSISGAKMRAEGNVVTLDFTDVLTDRATAITPDDSLSLLLPDGTLPMVELSLAMAAQVVCDGFPATIGVTEDTPSPVWSFEPHVVYTIDAPTVICQQGRLTFACGVPHVTYHYTIVDCDEAADGSIAAEKTAKSNEASIAMEHRYIVSVYATREGYNDSEVTTVVVNLTQ